MQLNSIRMPVESGQVFGRGFLVMGIEVATDFDARGRGASDTQARDKDTGERLWVVSGIDMDLMYHPEDDQQGGRFFRRSAEVKVRVASNNRPVPPVAQVPEFGPVVEFVGLTLTPYPDQSRCTGPRDGRPHRCGARQAYSMRASGIRAFSGEVAEAA